MVISGVVSSILYQKDDSDWKLFLVNLSQSDMCGSIKVSGNADVLVGDFVDIDGEYVEHKKYGTSFKASYVSQRLPDDVNYYPAYLVRNISGVGKVTANAIVKEFGMETFNVIQNSPERLADIPGISLKKANNISTQLNGKNMSFGEQKEFFRLGIQPILAEKIKKRYGASFKKILTTNPYDMIGKIGGINFKVADHIAIKAGIPKDSQLRIQNGYSYTMETISNRNGHAYVLENEVVKEAGKILELPEKVLKDALDESIESGYLVREKARIYAPRIYEMERDVARKLSALAKTSRGGDIATRIKIINNISKIESSMGITLDKIQKDAIVDAAMNDVMIITGGPGTGKTTVLGALIKYLTIYVTSSDRIILASPTGRAAKRMSEQTGMEASTIHRLVLQNVDKEDLENVDDDKSLFDNLHNFTPLDADVVIVDEMSMVNLSLMNMLLSVIAVGTKVIFVGDVDQLPAIGVGQVLKDLIQSGKFPVCRLIRIFRQAEGSGIIKNAYNVNNGKEIQLKAGCDDFAYFRCADPQKAINAIKTLVSERLPKKFGVIPEDVQILCPMRKGQLGVTALNPIMQEFLNPPSPSKKEYVSKGGTVFREGDKVMHIRNDYNIEWTAKHKDGEEEDGIGVFNGEVGKIIGIDDDGGVLILYDDDRVATYTNENMSEVELAYAVTIHKSQGSEYPVVIMPLIEAGPSSLYNKNMLYTGITRGKTCDIIIGNVEITRKMIQNKCMEVRNSTLISRIREFFP